MVSTDGYYDQSMCAEDFKKASYIVKKKTGKEVRLHHRPLPYSQGNGRGCPECLKDEQGEYFDIFNGSIVFNKVVSSYVRNY